MHIRKILWPTDFSACSSAALAHAILMAHRHGAALELLHVVVLHDHDPFHPTYHFPDREAIFRRLEELAAAGMKEQLSAHAGAALAIGEHQTRAVDAAPDILRFASDQDVDLIVMGSHGRRGLRRFVLGSVAEEVVRLARCPVMTVRERDPPRPSGIRRIVAPVDFSEHGEAAYKAALEIARAHGAALDVLHVVEAPVYRRYQDPHPEATDAPSIVDRARQSLEDFIFAIEEPGVPIRMRAVEGIAAPSITAYAAKIDADLIVIATHGLTGLEHFLLGSNAEKVVRTARCPVLTLKGPPGPDAHEAMAAGLA